ncbi:hypothetical protein BH23BAC3_BH23BAC3_16300 [soil metagenome]
MAILSEFDLWLFLAGLGIFHFGMHMMGGIDPDFKRGGV